MAAFDLIAFDLDGTVFGIPFKQEITQRVYRAFQAAHDRGITIAVATGRPVAMLGDQLKSAPWLDWGITVNGAQIVDMQGDQPSLCRPIDKQLALKLMRELGDKVSWSTFIDDTPYVEEKKVLHMADMGLGAFSDPDVTSAAADAGDAGGGEGKSVMERFGFNPIEAFASRSDMTIVPSIYKLVEELPKTSKVQKFGCAFDSAEDTDAAFSELTRVHKDLDIAILNGTRDYRRRRQQGVGPRASMLEARHRPRSRGCLWRFRQRHFPDGPFQPLCRHGQCGRIHQRARR